MYFLLQFLCVYQINSKLLASNVNVVQQPQQFSLAVYSKCNNMHCVEAFWTTQVIKLGSWGKLDCTLTVDKRTRSIVY